MSGATCRLSGQVLAAPLFRSLACAQCLFYIYFVTPPYSERYNLQYCGPGLLICDKFDNGPCSCIDTPEKVFNIPSYSLNSSLSQSIEDLQLNPPLPHAYPEIIEECCAAASKCCQDVLASDNEYSNPRKTSYSISREVSKREPKSLTVNLDVSPSCPATWDGWQCFKRSLPGIIKEQCPNYIFGDKLREGIENNENTVRKECLQNGEWFKNQGESEQEWTDYSECSVNHAFKVKLISGITAYSISVVAIIPAIIIISLHSGLKKQTVFRIHKNLLLSFLFLGLIYIFNVLFFVVEEAIGDHLFLTNHISCRIFFTLQLRYFRVSTFTWMLGEGVYLFRLLMCAFNSESENLKPYYIFCWGFPFVVTAVYSALREILDNGECWILPSRLRFIDWTIWGPCLLALCINIILVLIILYVLIKKLRYNPHLEPIQYTKAVRAVFMLVPVFGLHFLITIYRFENYIHQSVNLFLDGIQGFFVALIVCYTNKTVIECLRKWLGDQMEERKLRRQSEDKRIHFKRSIENSYATERLFLAVNNNRSYNNTNGKHLNLTVNLSRDSDEYEESVNISGMESHHDNDDDEGHIVITNINGETRLESPSKIENFV